MDESEEECLGSKNKSHMGRSIKGMGELIMTFSRIEACLKKKSVRRLLTVITVVVAGLLCYQLGKNVGEFIYHIMH